jgi:hypothetical protein
MLWGSLNRNRAARTLPRLEGQVDEQWRWPRWRQRWMRGNVVGVQGPLWLRPRQEEKWQDKPDWDEDQRVRKQEAESPRSIVGQAVVKKP